ncbi:hypothetical protein ACOMHN_046595 [Nucella lapillus]
MNTEEILADIGDAGRFQYLFTGIILVMELVIAWSMLQTAIVGATPKWWCVDLTTLGMDNMTLDNTTFQVCPSSSPLLSPSGGNGSGGDPYALNLSTSDVGGSCVRYYDTDLATIVSEWDLVCERKYIRAAINAIQMAGVMVGAVTAGQLADSVGRRVTCYSSMALHGLACVAAGLAFTWEMYAACRFFVGLSIGSYLVLHYVYVVEFVRHTWRPYLSSVPCWAIGAGLLCLVAWRIPNWRHLHYVCAAITAPMLLGWFVSPESLRWLAAKGRLEESEAVMEKIARMNGRPKMANAREQLNVLVEQEKSSDSSKRRITYHLLFHGWRTTLNTLVLGMSLSMSFYGIIFGVSALSGNLYLNMFLLSVVEVPLTLATACFTIYFGRRFTGSVFFLLASITGFAILIADCSASEDSKRVIINVIAITSKLFIAAAWSCMQTFTVELYPTVIRSLGMGAASTAARIGGILAPFVLEMDTADDAVKCYVIVGVIMAVSAVAILFLSETKGKSLADTLNQDQKTLAA